MSNEEQAIKIEWIDGQREPQCALNPAFPNGVDLNVSLGASPTCKIELPYPAKRCGLYIITCSACGVKTGVTTAGRPDDPRSVTIACNQTRKQQS